MILDRYIIRQFLINFAILLFVLTALVALIDLVINLDEFLEAAQEHTAPGSPDGSDRAFKPDDPDAAGSWSLLTAAWLIWDWNGPIVVLMYVYLCGLVVIGAMGFTFSELTRKREMVAILTSGLSLYRVAAPILIVGGALNVLALPVQELIIPRLADKLARKHTQLGEPTVGKFPVRFVSDGAGNLITASDFHPKLARLDNVNIQVRTPQGLGNRIITASQAFWNDRLGRWALIEGHEHLPARNGAIGPDTPSHNPEVLYFETTLSPQVLIANRAEIYPSLLPLTQLRRLRQSNALDPVLVSRIMHQRFSMLVVNMLVLIMGLPFFLSREPTDLLKQAVRASALCLGAWGSSLVVLQISTTHLNPVASAWMPVVIYLPISVWLMQRIKT